MSYKILKRILMGICIFVSIGAFMGGLCMLIEPSGKILQMQDLLIYFQKLPFAKYVFQNYIFSGIALIIVNGISNLIAFILCKKDKKIGLVLGTIFGITLMLWICIQFYMFPLNFMDVLYFSIGLIQFIIGYWAIIVYEQEHFEFDKANYKYIGNNNNEIIVYFSRRGATRKIAYEKANELGCDLFEIKTTEKTNGILGFWWCGRFGMHRWNMSLEKMDIDLKKYNKIIICSPIWVFRISCPIRTFIEKNKNDLKNIDLILVHFTNFIKYSYEFKNISKKYNIHIDKKISISSKRGKIRYIKEIN